MTCNKCYECECNDGKDYCQDCLPDEGTWLIVKSEKPDPFYADRNHAYMDSNENVWILNRARTAMIKLNGTGSGGEGKTYKAGQGITISQDGTISAVVTRDNDTITTVKPGNGILVAKTNNDYTVSLDSTKVPTNERLANVERQIGELKSPQGVATVSVLGKDGIVSTQTATKDWEVKLDPTVKANIDKIPALETKAVEVPLVNYINKYHGNGWVGKRDEGSGYYSAPLYYLTDKKSLGDLGFSVGDKLYLKAKFDVNSTTAIPATAQLALEAYDMANPTNWYVGWLAGKQSMQAKGNEIAYTWTLAEKDLKVNALNVRIDGIAIKTFPVRFTYLTLTTKPVTDSIPEPSGTLLVGADNLIKGTRDGSANTYGAPNGSYLGLAISEKNRGTGAGTYDTFNAQLGYPLNPGTWYTVSFFAKATSEITFGNHLYSPAKVCIVYSSTGNMNTNIDGDVTVKVNANWALYTISFQVYDTAPFTPKVLLGRMNGSVPSNTVLQIAGVCFYEGTGPRSWGASSLDVPSNTDVTEGINRLNTTVQGLSTKVIALEGRADNDTKYYAGNGLSLNGTTFSLNTNDLVTFGDIATKADRSELRSLQTKYNSLETAVKKLLQDLKDSGAWEVAGTDILAGSLKADRHIATGNINVFGGTPNGNRAIRTSNTLNAGDLAGGVE